MRSVAENFADAKNSTMDHKMEISRDQYIRRLAEQRGNGFIKVITGLRNVRLGFTQRVGVIEQNYTNDKGSRAKRQLEIDFYATRHDKSFYIQCTLSLKDTEKRIQEERPFMLIRDSYRKIIIVEDDIIPHNDENGIFIIGIRDFLSNEDILEY